jgi:4-amino-4-deoxy-L-arabinose transferase-like glycosyltransferase
VRRIELSLLALITLAYLGIAALYAVKTPAWQIPDEPAHYNYIGQVATNGCCPVLHMGAWDNAYLDRIKDAKFNPDTFQGRFDTIQYENHQPPLYYLLISPLYTVSEGNLTILRLFSALIGAGVVIVAWAVVRITFPRQPWLALATAAFVAFLPQHVAMMAGVENDGLAELIVGFTLLMGILYLDGRGIHPLSLGVLLGLGFLTKLTVYLPVLAIVGLVVLLRARRERWRFRRLVRQSAWILIPALVLGGLWWVRNVSIYGDLADFMGQKTHDSIVVGQPQPADYIAGMDETKTPPTPRGIGGWIRDGIEVTFKSFWGQFGWMGVPMTDTIYIMLLLFTIFVCVGALIALVRWRIALNAVQHEALIILGMAALMAFVQTVSYNLKFVQFQGRYLYPGLIPMALFVAAGLAGWTSLITPHGTLERPARIRWITVVVCCLFALLDVYALYRIILPALT